MNSETMICRRPDLIAVEMDGSTVMMDVQSGKYYRLTGVGGSIWELLEQPLSMQQLIDKLCGEYAVERETCAEQTMTFVQKLSDRGLLIVK